MHRKKIDRKVQGVLQSQILMPKGREKGQKLTRAKRTLRPALSSHHNAEMTG